MDPKAVLGGFMLVGFLLVCIALGAQTHWYVGVAAFGSILLTVGTLGNPDND